MSDDRIVKIGNQEIALGGFALLLMLVAILVPPVMYSLRLQEPSPPQLLVAICIGVFASMLYLWVLDATATIKFRSEWISKGVYGVAIVSILGTSVGVYKDAFQAPFLYQGEWLLTVQDGAGNTLLARRPAVFDPAQRRLELRLKDAGGLDEVIAVTISETQGKRAFSSRPSAAAKFVVDLSRRN